MSPAPPASLADAEAMTARYEELRNDAMTGTVGPRGGLALLVRHGVVAWIRAWDQCAPQQPVVAWPASGRSVGDNRELVALLADAALSRLARRSS